MSTGKKAARTRPRAMQKAAKRTPANHKPAKRTPAKRTPAKRTPAKRTPAKRMPAKRTQVDAVVGAIADPRLALLARSGFRLTRDGGELDGNELLEVESDHLVGPYGLALPILQGMSRLAAGIFDLSEVRHEQDADDDGETIRYQLQGRPRALTFRYGEMATTARAELVRMMRSIDLELDRADLPWRFACVTDTKNDYVWRRRVVLLPSSWARELRDALQVEVGLDPLPAPAAEVATYTPRTLVTIDEIVPASHRFAEDGECVDLAADYERLVERIAALARPELRLDSITCVDQGSTRLLTLRRGHDLIRAELRGDTDWVDLDPLLRALNRALPDGGRRQFYACSWDGMGQEFGVLFTGTAEIAQLRDAGYKPR